MFNRIASLMRQDLTNSLRDNILLYMIFGPVLLALGARLFLPGLDQTRLTIAVTPDLPAPLVQRLQLIGQVQVLADAPALRERVLRSDDVVGIVLNGGAAQIVLEGNEAQGVQALTGIVAQALNGEQVARYQHTRLAEARSLLTEYAAIMFVMIGSLLGALVMAFNMIEDKETRAVRALGVSPLSMFEFTLARGLFALALSLVLALASTFILLGAQVNYGLLVVAFLFSAGLPILTGYVIGGLADNQLKAIAILKFYMLAYLTLPIISAFVPRAWHVAFYPLPNYWMWQAFENVIIGQLGPANLWLAGSITLATSLALVALFLPLLRRQLKLR
jgi:ABC-2 type transport system permease protein